AGGTSQRLKPGLAMMRLLSSQLELELDVTALDVLMAVTVYFGKPEF
ncbi:MAG: hypothetical protein RL703_780, partial [Pseudomonadota bacterium]